MIHSLRFAALSLVLLGACSSTDAAPEIIDPPETQTLLPQSAREDLQGTLSAVVAAGVAPGVSLTVAHPSYRSWSSASGVASLDTNESLTADERFRAGSMLKMSVATAILQLVEQHELSLDDDLSELLPPSIAARIADAPAITLKMLLKHTSGFAEFSDDALDALALANPTYVWTFDEFLDLALSRPRVFAPGAGFSYNNTDYILLGKVLEQATGEPWRAVLRERVFARAELEQSELPEDGDARCGACSRGYELKRDRLVDATELDPSMAGAAGGNALITTTQDLVQFLRSLLGGRLFDEPDTLNLMLDFLDTPIPEEGQTGYGLGLTRFQIGDTEFIGHLGGTAGFQGFALCDRQTGLLTSGYMNRRGDLGAFILPVLEAVARLP